MLSYETLIEKRRRMLIGAVLAAAFAMIAMTVMAQKGHAADTGGPKVVKALAPAPLAETVPAWTGVGFDVHGSLATGTADFGGPVNLSMDGQMAGLTAFWNHRFGVLVLGADAGYDRVWGDLHSFGIDYAWNIGLRAGLLATDRTLVYARGEWLRAQGSGSQHIDGYGIGGGIEVRLPGTPASLALEWMHDWMDKDALGPSVDVTADRITTRLRFNFDRDITKVFVAQ